jgi:hypothetical protein
LYLFPTTDGGRLPRAACFFVISFNPLDQAGLACGVAPAMHFFRGESEMTSQWSQKSPPMALNRQDWPFQRTIRARQRLEKRVESGSERGAGGSGLCDLQSHKKGGRRGTSGLVGTRVGLRTIRRQGPKREDISLGHAWLTTRTGDYYACAWKQDGGERRGGGL